MAIRGTNPPPSRCKKRHRQRKLHCFQFGGGGGGGGKTKACDDVEGGGGGCHPRFLVPNEEDRRGFFEVGCAMFVAGGGNKRDKGGVASKQTQATEEGLRVGG